MIDPNNITKFSQTKEELEEVLLFWICVAGKTAAVISKSLDRFLKSIDNYEGNTPFEKIKSFGYDNLPERLKECGIGCYSLKAKSIWILVNSDLDLRTCTLEELEDIYGIGRKTSRCFLMHSRENARCAGLDTHILKYLRGKGYNVPISTPGSKRQYLEIEKLFLKYADRSEKSIAKFDLDIWKEYANGNKGKDF